MSLENLISIAFTDSELQELDSALQTIGKVLKDKTQNLSPEQRRQYGSIAEKNKLFVNKAKELMEQNPEFIPPFLDKEEFDKDHQARAVLEQRLIVISSLTEQMTDTKVLLDHDNYFNALTFYRNIRYLKGENVPGTTTLYSEMQQFFSSKPVATKEGKTTNS